MCTCACTCMWECACLWLWKYAILCKHWKVWGYWASPSATPVLLHFRHALPTNPAHSVLWLAASKPWDVLHPHPGAGVQASLQPCCLCTGIRDPHSCPHLFPTESIPSPVYLVLTLLINPHILIPFSLVYEENIKTKSCNIKSILGVWGTSEGEEWVKTKFIGELCLDFPVALWGFSCCQDYF